MNRPYIAVEDAVILLTVSIDEDTAPPLNSGKDEMEDIIVLHLEKGKDFFITVTGDYLPSCFGSSLETLVHLHTYIREVPVAQLVDLVSYLPHKHFCHSSVSNPIGFKDHTGFSML